MAYRILGWTALLLAAGCLVAEGMLLLGRVAARAGTSEAARAPDMWAVHLLWIGGAVLLGLTGRALLRRRRRPFSRL